MISWTKEINCLGLLGYFIDRHLRQQQLQPQPQQPGPQQPRPQPPQQPLRRSGRISKRTDRLNLWFIYFTIHHFILKKKKNNYFRTFLMRKLVIVYKGITC